MKTISPAVGTSQKQIDRFLRECSILAQLEHPNIVAFRECGEAGGLIYLGHGLRGRPGCQPRG